MDLLLALLTFCCGAAYECACVFWVHYSERGERWKAACWSCLAALVTVIGVESFIKKWIFAVAYIIGYGAGTFVAITVKARLDKK